VESLPGASTSDISAEFTYMAAGRLASITDPLDHVTTLSYDNAGRISRVSSALDIRTRLSYDPLGRLSEVMAPAQASEPTTLASTVTYDSLSRVAATTYNDSGGSVIRHASRSTTTSRPG